MLADMLALSKCINQCNIYQRDSELHFIILKILTHERYLLLRKIISGKTIIQANTVVQIVT